MKTTYFALGVICAAGIVACSDGPSNPDPGPDFDLTCNVSTDRLFASLGRDAIPALTTPEATTADQNVNVNDADRVLGVVINGEARAYPFGVMWWHEIVNDTLGGQSVLVTYCPLTGSGIAFDPRVDGQLREFGVSGLLFENNLVMFDRQVENLWNQMSLEAMCGPERGTALARFPIVETTWSHWKTLHPNTTVMTYNTGAFLNYGRYPYDDYDDLNNPVLFSPSSPIDRSRPPKELTLGVFDGNNAVAYPFGVLSASGSVSVVNDSIGSTPLVISYIGSEEFARAYHRTVLGQVLTFSVENAGTRTFVDAETGTIWDAGGVAIQGPLTGEQLTPFTDSFVAFWFAWSVYYPNLRKFT